MKMKPARWKLSEVAFNTFNYTFLVIFMFMCIYPFYYIFIYSISIPNLAAKGLTIVPAGFTLSNYWDIFQLPGIAHAAFISVVRTVLGTSLMVFCSSFLGYLMTQEELFLRRVIYRYFIVTMYLNAGLIPGYLLMRYLGLYDNLLVYILPGSVSVFNMILVKTYIEQTPSALQDSAKIDGAGFFMIFRRIIFPLITPIIATIALFGALGQWNSWFDNLLLVPKRSLKTLQLILWEYITSASAISLDPRNVEKEMMKKLTPMAVRMTVTMIVTLPIIFVYPFVQRYFVKGLMIGAIKG
jgi:putative aldouronate transport system permease protein